MSHVAAQFMDIIMCLQGGACLYFCDEKALTGTLPIWMKEIKPTLFMAVPRVWEKMEEKLREAFASKTRIVNWVRGVTTPALDSMLKGGSGGIRYAVAKKLVLKKVWAELGLDECIMTMYGAAPLPQKSRDFFFSLGIFLNGIYGMSETSGPMTLTHTMFLSDYSSKACGSVVLGGEIKLENPNQEGEGEVCFRARNCFMGYLKNEKATTGKKILPLNLV
jgi:long-chain-fatty-acid--CoA ligase ACSBG